MKKIVKWVSIIVVVCVVLALSAKSLIEWRMLPNSAFDLAEAPSAPNYSDDYYWLAHPAKQDSSDLMPANIDKTKDLVDKPVDVFFIHSTGYVGPGGWNSNMAAENSEMQSTEYMLTSMASIFNGCCNVYAPHFREAHLSAFVSDDVKSSYSALDLAYQDVEQGFEYFLTHFNQGRPFMIVSHSQGSVHGLRLLENRIDNNPLQSKLVAAYTLGYWLPTDKFKRSFINLDLCAEGSQTGCIISYDAYGENGQLSGHSRHWFKTGWEQVENKRIACVNPLTWESNLQRADSSFHQGAMPVEFKRTVKHMLLAENPNFTFQELPNVTSGLTWAECQENGVLYIAEQRDGLFSNHLNNQDKSYHLLDFSLFYANLRQNAIARSRAYLEQNPDSK